MFNTKVYFLLMLLGSCSQLISDEKLPFFTRDLRDGRRAVYLQSDRKLLSIISSEGEITVYQAGDWVSVSVKNPDPNGNWVKKSGNLK